MLGWFRKFVRSKVGFALFVLLIISFGIFFQDPFSGVMGGGFVQVGDREIRPLDVNRQVDVVLERIRQEENQVLSAREAAQQGITGEIFQQLVSRATILEYAEKIGVRASKSAVTNALANAPVFKDALGRLSMDAVARYAQEQQKMSIAEFQDFERDNMTVGYIQEAAYGGVATPEVLMRPLLSYFGEQRTLSVARLTDGAISEPKKPTPEELRDFYARNSDRFRQPERRRIAVLSYSADDFLDKVEVTPAQLKSEYDRRLKDFSTPETRDIMQFTAPDRNALQAFIDLVKQGLALDEALQKSPNITRADLSVKPGDLTEKQYNDLVFALPVGQVQGPLNVQGAFLAVQVKQISPGVAKPFEQVVDQVSQQLRRTEAIRLYQQSEESFYDMAGGSPLEDISKQIGAPVIQLAPVDATGQTRNRQQNSLLAKNAAAVSSLFTLNSGQMTDVIEGDGERSIFRLNEILPTYTLPFEEVEEELTNLMMTERVQEAANKVANDMIAALKAGEPFARAAAASKMAALGAVTINRAQQPPISAAVANAAFGMQAGEVAIARNESGEPWVIKIDKVEPVSAEAAQAIRTQVSQTITQGLQNDVREVFIRGVQAEIQVKPNDQAISRYFDDLTKDAAQ